MPVHYPPVKEDRTKVSSGLLESTRVVEQALQAPDVPEHSFVNPSEPAEVNEHPMQSFSESGPGHVEEPVGKTKNVAGPAFRDPLWEASKQFMKGQQDESRGNRVEQSPGCPLKRPRNDEDTWGFECDLHFRSFGYKIKPLSLENPLTEDWEGWNRLFNEAINHSGIDRMWPMSRVVMLVDKSKNWFKVTAVAHQTTVMSAIKVLLPHAEPHHFTAVMVDGQAVTPVSIPPGLQRIIISCLMNKFEVVVNIPESAPCFLECDVTTKGIDVLKKVEADYGFHLSCIKLLADKKLVDSCCPILTSGLSNFEVKREASVVLPGELPVVQLPCGLPFPPEHSDLIVTPSPKMLRVAARHPIWSSVRTVLIHCDAPIKQMLDSLFPDMKKNTCMKMSSNGVGIGNETRIGVLNLATRHEVAFESTKSFPVATIEFVIPTTIIDQMKIGTADWAGNDCTKRCVRSPFQTKAYEKHFPNSLSLVNLAAQYMAHSSSAYSLITMVDGKSIDPRVCIDQIAEHQVITIRCCPLVGGAKKNEDVKKMLTQQLLGRGVKDENVQSRIESILSCVPAEKLRTFVAEGWVKQWDGIKNLANEGKIRLVTVEELKAFQQSKKLNRVQDDKSTEVSSGSGSSLKTSASAITKQTNLHEVNVDLTYFKAAKLDVCELSAEAFGPDAKGVAIMHLESAQRFLPPTRLSADYLAIVAIGSSGMSVKGSPDFRMIPATDATGNPILVPATIINFGDVPVHFEQRNSAKIESQSAIVVEFTIWKSEVERWDLIKSPMLYLGQSFQEVRNATIMGSWAIKFFSANKKPTEHAKGDYAHGFFRVLEADVDPMLSRSGWNGTYFTPKNDAKKPHQDYMVINVPNHDIQQMKALAQKTVNCLGIVKMPQALALRCRRENGHLVLKAVFPDLPQPEFGHFEQGDELYQLKHVTFNVKSSELSEALSDLGWLGAKAIRPIGSTAWLIAAKQSPPSAHLCLNGDFVVVTPHQKTANGTPKGPQVPATAAFKSNLVRSGDKEAPVESGTSRLEELKTTMHGQVQAMIDAKLASHTSQIERLQKAVHDTTKDVQVLKEGQVVAEQRLVGVEQAVQASTSSLLNQMTSMFGNLQSALTDRFDKFEARHDPDEKRQRKS